MKKTKFKVGDVVKVINKDALEDQGFYFTMRIKEGFPNRFTVSKIKSNGFAIELKELDNYGIHGYDPDWFAYFEFNPSRRKM